MGKRVQPLLSGELKEQEAFEEIILPFKNFMMIHVRDEDIRLFEKFVSDEELPSENRSILQDKELRILIPAFLLSEIRKGFEIGFLILLPFLVIDLVVSTLTMSMGMMMLPPTVVSLPFKVLFFVLIDGWNLLVEELLKSVA